MRVNIPRRMKRDQFGREQMDVEASITEIEQAFARIRDTTAGSGMPSAAPALASSAGRAGQFAYDATHFYVCVAADTWVRCVLATF